LPDEGGIYTLDRDLLQIHEEVAARLKKAGELLGQKSYTEAESHLRSLCLLMESHSAPGELGRITKLFYAPFTSAQFMLFRIHVITGRLDEAVVLAEQFAQKNPGLRRHILSYRRNPESKPLFDHPQHGPDIKGLLGIGKRRG
jgi:hypothetical protein